MYEIYIDGRILDYPGDKVNCVTDPELKLALNDSGYIQFDVPPGNPEFNNILSRNSEITVLKDGAEIFFGEVRDIEKDSYNIKNVYSVGELSFLYDSIQPPAEYHDLSPRQMLETWLNIHNSQVEDRKKFYVGIVTVHDSNDSLYRYTNRETTLDAIREKLVGKLGGYLKIRKVNGVRYLDWLATVEEYGKYCEQSIEFGTNLLDYTESLSAADLATAVIPLGARLEESPIKALDAYTDITSVNNGVDYVYIPEAVNRFGWVKKVVTWDDITDPSVLKKKGEDWLKDNQYETMVLELTAVDLSDLGNDFDSFELGDIVPAFAEPYGLDRAFPVQEMTIYLHSPEKNTLVLGTTEKKTFTKQAGAVNKSFSEQLENTRQTTAWLQSAIDNATAMMTGSRGGYKVSEYDEDGRWLRDLYMNAPNKEDATLVMQINMNGIGFSRDGFDGPYKNAWTIDGVLLGEFLKAGSVQAEALSAEYKASVTDEIDTTVTSKFQVAENLISAEVTRATNQEVQLAAAIQVTSEQITQKVSKGDVSSQLSIESGLISITGPRLKIDTEKFKLAYDGTTQILDAYLSISSGSSAIEIHDGYLMLLNKQLNEVAGLMTYDPGKDMYCLGSYGRYAKFGLGYWAGTNEFYPMVQINRLYDYDGTPSVEFKDIGTMAINGRVAYDGYLGFVTQVYHNEDGSLHVETGGFDVRGGLILE